MQLLQRIGVVLVLCCPVGAIAVNLVQDSSFEHPAGAKLPAGWTGYAPHDGAVFFSDATVAHSGTRSAAIETTSDQIGILVSNAVPVAPGEALKLSCWMRTADLTTSSGGMLSLSAGFQDRYGSYFTWKRHRFDLPENHSDWFYVENTVTVPDRAARMTLQAGQRFMTGKLLVDDLELNSAHTAAIRFDVATSNFEPGPTTLPLILIDRTGKNREFQLHAQPGNIKTSVQSSARETTVVLPFNFTKRGKTVPRLTLSVAGEADSETSITGTVPPLLTSEPLVPTHWLIEDKQKANFESRFWIAEPPATRAQLSAHCELIDNTSATVATWKSAGPLTDVLTFTMQAPAKVEKPTTYTVRLNIERNGKVEAVAEQPWRFIHAEETRVTMGDDGYPRVHGKPFFPIGMYMAGGHTDLKEAGFNVMQSYNAFGVEQGERPNNRAILQFLDNAYESGMKALVFVNHGLATRLGREESLRRIHMFRNHPAMLVWYEEEAVARGLKPLSWLSELVGDMRREGSGHPVLLGDLVDYGVKVKDRSHMLPEELMDAGIWWWYPTPPRNAPVVEDYEGDNAGPALEYVPPAFLVQSKTNKPLWIALQCYKKPDTADARYPTAAEYRCQAYLSIACGAKGLYYYTGYGEQGGGIFHHPDEGHWTELKSLVRELRDNETIIMSGDANKPATCSDKMISLKLKENAGKRVLIAVNRCNRTLTPSITFPGIGTGQKLRVLTENREVVSPGNEAFTDQFGPYAVHLYQVE